MKKNKLFVVLSVVTIIVISLSTAAFAAADYGTPAEIVAGLTGKTTDEVTAERQAGNSYGSQAQAAGKLDEFKAERLQLYEQNLTQAVQEDRLTQSEADKLLEEMTLRMEDCDGIGTGNGQGECNGTGAGTGAGICDGTGIGQNSDRKNGSGLGMGRGDGSGNRTGVGCGSCTNQD